MKKYVDNGIVYKVSKIESLEEREEIEKKLINRVPYKDIAKEYKVSIPTLRKYFDEVLAPRLAKALQKEDKKNLQNLMDKLNDIACVTEKMLRACEDWLSDPEDKTKFNLDPRASEVMIIYNVLGAKGQKIRKKDTLQHLLNILLIDGYNVTNVISKNADPRKLVLDTAGEIREQLKLFAQITGELSNIKQEVNINVLVENLAGNIIDSTKNDPNIQTSLISGLRAMVENAKH